MTNASVFNTTRAQLSNPALALRQLWRQWRLAKLRRRIDQVEAWMDREREVHAEHMAELRAEADALYDAEFIAAGRANARPWGRS